MGLYSVLRLPGGMGGAGAGRVGIFFFPIPGGLVKLLRIRLFAQAGLALLRLSGQFCLRGSCL